jgi:hypothetical protein
VELAELLRRALQQVAAQLMTVADRVDLVVDIMVEQRWRYIPQVLASVPAMVDCAVEITY